MKEDSADIQIPQKQRLRFGDPILIQRLQSKREGCNCRRDETIDFEGTPEDSSIQTCTATPMLTIIQ